MIIIIIIIITTNISSTVSFIAFRHMYGSSSVAYTCRQPACHAPDNGSFTE
jgi:hypothetical protein